MAEYALTANSNSVLRTADNALIPNDQNNRDWIAYQAWLAAGSVPDPYVAPAAAPPAISFLQFMALFTATEQAAIVNSADTQTKLFVLMASGAGTIDLGNAQVVAGVNYLATTGLITAARAAAILANQPPV